VYGRPWWRVGSCRVVSVRRLLPLLSFASLSLVTSFLLAAPAAAPPDDKAEFLRWANEVARAKKLSVCQAGRLRYPGEQPGYFAALGEERKGLEPYVNQTILFSNGKKHWFFAERGLTVHVGCDVPAAWEELEKITIEGRDWATNYFWQNHDVTFIEGEPEELGADNSDVDGRQEIDWLKAWEHDVDWDRSDPNGPSGESDNGFLIALPPGSKWLASWKAPTFVPFGEKNRQGPADVDLAVSALDLGKAGIRIVVDVTDERLVATPVKADAKALVRSDHLELWWVPADASLAKQLGIGMRADGSADVRWLLPAGANEKTPAVRRNGRHFEIDLSSATLGLDPAKPNTARDLSFTVAFSDTDTPGAKQETVVATSPVRWNRRETFGQLMRFQSASRRFPSFGESM
jgi:hypothetical protein